MAEPFTSADFHELAERQVQSVLVDTLASSKLEWSRVEALLDAARAVCRSEIDQNGRVRVHAVRAQGDSWVQAEEAYIGLSVADGDKGIEWLSETWWLSDLVIAEKDVTKVKAIAEALDRSVARIRQWLESSDPVRPQANDKAE